MDTPLISVVIPIYNSQEYLEEALNSVINQTYNNLQILVLDDCSTDDSISILKNLNDPRIELYESKAKKGQAFQLNRGISMAAGEFVCIMHSDDIMHTNKLERQLAFLQINKSVGVCGCHVELIGEANGSWYFPEKNQDCKDLILTSVPFAHPTVIFRKSVLSQLNIWYKQEMVPAEDYDLWVRLCEKTDYGNVQEVLFKYRIHKNQIGNTEKEKQHLLVEKIREKIIEQLFKIEENNADLCYKTIYRYNEVELPDAIRCINLLWNSNKKTKIFSNKALKGRLKHVLFSVLTASTFNQRIRESFSSTLLYDYDFFKTIVKSLFFGSRTI